MDAEESALEFSYEDMSSVGNTKADRYVLLDVRRRIGTKDYGFQLYFPDTEHTSEGHGETHLTNRALAEIWFDPGSAGRTLKNVKAKWSGWKATKLDPALKQILSVINARVDAYISEEGRKIREEYRAHGTMYRQKLGIKNKRVYLTPEEAAISGKKYRMVAVIARRYRNGRVVRKDSEILYDVMTPQQKREFEISRKQDWVRKMLGRSIELERSAGTDYGKVALAQLMLDPYRFGLFVGNIFRKSATEAMAVAKNYLYGMKSPDIQERTKYNRTSRGNPDSPPLFETGEFIESLEYEVY